jgi:hypothetical protein
MVAVKLPTVALGSLLSNVATRKVAGTPATTSPTCAVLVFEPLPPSSAFTVTVTV